jgi:pilus assembly protein Flp/PilA
MKNLVFSPTTLRILHDESGQDLIEYALVAGLIALGAVVSIKGLSTKLINFYTLGGVYLNALIP